MDFFEYLKTLPKMRQKQLRQAVFVDLAGSPDEITTFSKEGRELMAKEFDLFPFTVEKELKSSDGSTKFLLKTADNNYIETVLLNFKDGRNTVVYQAKLAVRQSVLFVQLVVLVLKEI